ncbi:MAG: ComEC/Rec2 family competence protein [Patescibacteria group bacterium]|nr:ComEC/Rec2 family competence protein [Patescibacteria group bacterium]MDD5121065.1 ComEC/Rec2 family competence protein [Patescibacteria group bacterium]MDD5221573.1 ComEC/Rec2 family competence protein [Patescibacteria group bacterium]MDD5396016.1 ComEC/Rec2 family competence protein [Patescibacteria group bacterium]
MAKFSKAKVFTYLLIAFIVGVGLSSLFHLSVYWLCWPTLITLWLIIFIKSRLVKIISLIILFFIFGIWRAQLAWPKVNDQNVVFYNDQEVVLKGLISQEPIQQSKQTVIIVSVKQVNDRPVFGKILVKVPLFAPYQYGQELQIDCRLITPENFGQFNYQNYLAKDNIWSLCQNPKEIKILSQNRGNWLLVRIYNFKHAAQKMINENMTEPQGGLFSSLLLGAGGYLPQDFRDALSKTGTSHIVAVSGLHIVIMISLVEIIIFSVFGIKRKHAFYLTAFFIIIYVILTGLAASAVRAGIMGILLLFAKKIGRDYQAGNAIFLVAALMLIFNPFLLLWDVGWQLSFLSILGLIYLSPRFQVLLIKIPDFKIWPIRSYLVATFSAYLFTLPLILYYFGNLSLSAPLANSLVLGFFPWVMMSGFIFILTGLAWPFLIKILVWPIWLILTYVIKIIDFFAQVTWLSWHLGGFSLVWIIFYFIVLIIILKSFLKKQNAPTG